MTPETPASGGPPGELAFRARVVPATSTKATAGGAGPDLAIELAAPAVSGTPPDPATPAEPSSGSPASPDARRVPREEKATAVPDASEPKPHAADTGSAALHWQAAAPEVRPEPGRPETAHADAPPAARTPEVIPLKESPPATTSARDIQLQFSGQEGRVQVHLVERGGELQVAVHTPDAHLAGTLREDLPSLAARLEQTGFRAETWHGPAAAYTNRAQEPAAGSFRQDLPDSPNGNPGSREQQQQQQDRQQRQAEEVPEGRAAGQDFSWLFSSLQ